MTFNVPAGTEAGVAVIREDATPGELVSAASDMKAQALSKIVAAMNAVLMKRDDLRPVRRSDCEVGVDLDDEDLVVLRIDDGDLGDYAEEARACEEVLRALGVDAVRWPSGEDEFWIPRDPTKPGTLR